MGADVKAMLFYGFPIPEIVVDYHELNDTWRDVYRPPQPEDGSGNYDTPAWDEWRKKFNEWEKTPQNVEIDWSGGENSEAYFVHCAGLEKSVDWDKQLAVSPSDLEHLPEAKKWLHEFCDRFNIPKSEPQWFLAALYF
jgi:hypothetical protein